MTHLHASLLSPWHLPRRCQVNDSMGRWEWRRSWSLSQVTSGWPRVLAVAAIQRSLSEIAIPPRFAWSQGKLTRRGRGGRGEICRKLANRRSHSSIFRFLQPALRDPNLASARVITLIARIAASTRALWSLTPMTVALGMRPQGTQRSNEAAVTEQDLRRVLLGHLVVAERR
jgi:hypothetical protein